MVKESKHMNEKTFDHHSGGVVQVRHLTRYGAVPEALLEDRRLDLDARAVGAWLAVKQDGWQILVRVLRMRLARGEQTLLGKDRWQRIANELEAAGYLSRRKINGTGGRWNWHVTFTPVPECLTKAGFAGSGATVSRLPSVGCAASGKPGHKVVPTKVVTNIATTTEDRVGALGKKKVKNASHLPADDNFQTLHYPKVSASELVEITKMIALCDVNSQQAVLDEVEGIRQAGGVTRGVVPLMRALINKISSREFASSAGSAIRIQRERRTQNEKAIAAAVTPIIKFPQLDRTDFVATLPPNLAKRALEAEIRTEAARVLVHEAKTYQIMFKKLQEGKCDHAESTETPIAEEGV